MSLRRRVFRGGALLGVSNVVGQALRFVRNVIVARILTPEDFGVAATFWIATGFLATISELGFQQLLIQTPEGDEERFGATIQSMMTARSLLIGAVIFALAGPVAAMFRVPEATWAFRLLAVVSVLGGFRHCDLHRLKRGLRFGPAVVTGLVAAIVTTFLAWPIATYVGDYSAFVWLAIIQTGMGTLFSHVLAERPFRLGWDWQVVRRSLSFGWPLLLNSLLIYAALQGDRIILAGAYTKAELGLYSIALGLAMTPCGMVAGVMSSLMLPMLSRAQDDRRKFQRHYVVCAQLLGVVGVVVGAVFFILGPALISLLYGSKYGGAGVVIGWLAARESVRLVRVAVTAGALALGDTRNSLVANLFRQCGLALALAAAATGASLRWIAVAGVVGEVIALSSSVVWVRWRHGLPMRLAAVPGSLLLGGLLLSAWFSGSDILRGDLFAAACASAVAVVGSCAAALLAFPELRRESRTLAGLAFRRSSIGCS